MKHKIVSIDDYVKPLPEFDFDHEITYHSVTTPAQLPERIKDATIVVASATRLTREGILAAPNLQLMACNGTGTDYVDKVACRERGIAVCHVPAQGTVSVAEHGMALYYGLRRNLLDFNRLAKGGEAWSAGQLHLKLNYANGLAPRTNSEETCVIMGYGSIGKHLEHLCSALGMHVLISERKGASEIREGRTAFEQCVQQGTVFIIITPLDDSTRDLISTPELEAMDPTALIINISRGGTVNEAALVKALKEGQISGAATDVFEVEPATHDNSPLLDPSIPNLLLTPHVAWYSSRTIKGLHDTVRANLEGFVAGQPQNLVVPPGLKTM